MKSKSLLQEGGSRPPYTGAEDDGNDMGAPHPSLAPLFQKPQHHLRRGTTYEHNDFGAATDSKHRLVSGSGPRYTLEKCYEECDKFLAARDLSESDPEDLVIIGTDTCSGEEDIFPATRTIHSEPPVSSPSKPAKKKNAKKKVKGSGWCAGKHA